MFQRRRQIDPDADSQQRIGNVPGKQITGKAEEPFQQCLGLRWPGKSRSIADAPVRRPMAAGIFLTESGLFHHPSPITKPTPAASRIHTTRKITKPRAISLVRCRSAALRVKDQRRSTHQPRIVAKRRRHDANLTERDQSITPDDIMNARRQKVEGV